MPAGRNPAGSRYLLFRSDFDVPGFFLHACARTDHSVSEIIIFKSAAGSISFRSAVSQSCSERALRSELEEELDAEMFARTEELDKAEEADEKAARKAEEREKMWKAAHQEWLLARDKIISRFNETNAAWNVECARAAAELMNVEKQLAAAEAKAVRLERELTEANAQVLEAKGGQLAALRAGKASEAAHKVTLQSKQWDRGKMRVKQ